MVNTRNWGTSLCCPTARPVTAERAAAGNRSRPAPPSHWREGRVGSRTAARCLRRRRVICERRRSWTERFARRPQQPGRCSIRPCRTASSWAVASARRSLIVLPPPWASRSCAQRKFLKAGLRSSGRSSATTPASLAPLVLHFRQLTPPEPFSNTGMNKKIKVGIIGSQFISHIHAISLKRCAEAEAFAVASHTPGHARDFAAKLGIPHHFTDYKKLLAMPELDMVV